MKKIILASLVTTTALSGCAVRNAFLDHAQKGYEKHRVFSLPTPQEAQEILARAKTEAVPETIGSVTYKWLPAGGYKDLTKFYVDVSDAHYSTKNTATAMTKSIGNGIVSIGHTTVFCFDGYSHGDVPMDYTLDGKFKGVNSYGLEHAKYDRPLMESQALEAKTICALSGFTTDSEVVYQPGFGSYIPKTKSK